MRKEFLALVEKVKATGIADALCKAATVDERVTLWVKFDEENQDLFKEIVSWSVEFNKNACDPIFKKGEKVQNPLEIAVCISISGTAEDDIFENWEDLQSEIRNLGNGYATDLADAMDEMDIAYIELTEPIWEED